MYTNEAFQGVSNCYVFKSQLQEYAQKVGLPTPVYETTKEGPSHEPYFKSTVIVNNVRYDSLPGFSNRKVAEQSAAEVALLELAKSGDFKQSISLPIHETGLCKNLLQEYAQKMNYAIPLYQCQKEGSPGRVPLFSCTVEIGGIRYVGAVAKTKKEAEIKVARTALLAIRSSKPDSSTEPASDSQLTVLPSNKKRNESNTRSEETADVPKPKKARFKKKKLKNKLSGKMEGQTEVQKAGNCEGNLLRNQDAHDWMSNVIQSENQKSARECGFVPHVNDASAKHGQSTASFFNHGDNGTPDVGAFPLSYGNITPFSQEVSMVSGAFPQVDDVTAKNGESTAASYINHGDNGTHESGAFPISYGNISPSAKEVNTTSGAFPQLKDVSTTNGQSTPASYFNHGENGSVDVAAFPLSHGNTTPLAKEANMVSGAGEAVSLGNNSSIL